MEQTNGIYIPNEQVLGVDCDDTLVLWRDPEEGEETVDIVDPYDNRTVRLVVHKPHLKLIKDRAARGCAILVWSQGGPRWAKAVADALNVKYAVCMAKPFAVVDDLPASVWLAERIYLKANSNYGRFEVKNEDSNVS